jgi:TIR domain
MAEVFLSYASPDREKARALAEFLEERSCSVFWDRAIPPGRSFDEVIEGALREARAVIVLWSADAVASDWVKAEAEEGAARGLLVPAMIEVVPLPLRFRRIQAADLSAWDFRSSTREVEQLLSSLGKLLGRELSPGQRAVQPPAGPLEGRPGVVTEAFQAAAASPRPRAASRSCLKAFGFHLLLGSGLFYLGSQSKRRWLYVIPPLYAVVDVVLAVNHVEPFARSGGPSFVVALILYALSFIEVGLTCRSRRKGHGPA